MAGCAGDVKLRKKSDKMDLRGLHYSLPLKLRSSQEELRSFEIDDSILNRPLSSAELIYSFGSSNSKKIFSFLSIFLLKFDLHSNKSNLLFKKSK